MVLRVDVYVETRAEIEFSHKCLDKRYIQPPTI